jgi:hypothetical protein
MPRDCGLPTGLSSVPFPQMPKTGSFPAAKDEGGGFFAFAWVQNREQRQFEAQGGHIMRRYVAQNSGSLPAQMKRRDVGMSLP